MRRRHICGMQARSLLDSVQTKVLSMWPWEVHRARLTSEFMHSPSLTPTTHSQVNFPPRCVPLQDYYTYCQKSLHSRAQFHYANTAMSCPDLKRASVIVTLDSGVILNLMSYEIDPIGCRIFLCSTIEPLVNGALFCVCSCLPICLAAYSQS